MRVLTYLAIFAMGGLSLATVATSQTLAQQMEALPVTAPETR